MAVQALEIAKSALIAQRAAMEISSHNVANAETPGYVRQTASLSSIAGNTGAGGEAGGIGNGVELTRVLRSQDACLTVQINAQTASKGRDQVLADTLGRHRLGARRHVQRLRKAGGEPDAADGSRRCDRALPHGGRDDRAAPE